MIYFLREEGSNYVKIGYSKDKSSIGRRKSTLQSGNPRKISLLFKFEGEIYEEKEIHEDYKEYNVRGEWFDIYDKLKKPNIEAKIKKYIDNKIKKRIRDEIKNQKLYESIFEDVKKSFEIVMEKYPKDSVYFSRVQEQTSYKLKEGEYAYCVYKHIINNAINRFGYGCVSSLKASYLLNTDGIIEKVKEHEKRVGVLSKEYKEEIRLSIKSSSYSKMIKMDKNTKLIILDCLKKGVINQDEICLAGGIESYEIMRVWGDEDIQNQLKLIKQQQKLA